MSNVRLAETSSTPHVGMTWVDAPVNYLADLSIKPVTYNPPVGTGLPRRDGNYRNFLRITTWLSVSAIFWVAGGLAPGQTRLWLWGIAIAIEYASPAAGMWVPECAYYPGLDELLAEVARVRAQGYAFSHQESTPGVDGIAVAVADPATDEAVSLCIVYPSKLVTLLQRDAMIAALAKGASGIAAAVGDGAFTFPRLQSEDVS